MKFDFDIDFMVLVYYPKDNKSVGIPTKRSFYEK